MKIHITLYLKTFSMFMLKEKNEKKIYIISVLSQYLILFLKGSTLAETISETHVLKL